MLELIYSNVCGSMNMKTPRESKYFVTLIDNVTKKVYIYWLRSKDQVLSYFPQLHAMVERETRKKLKSFKSNNDREHGQTYLMPNGGIFPH